MPTKTSSNHHNAAQNFLSNLCRHLSKIRHLVDKDGGIRAYLGDI